MDKTVAQTRATLGGLSSKYKPDHPRVIAARNEFVIINATDKASRAVADLTAEQCSQVATTLTGGGE
jgi:hypothetical protein